MLLQVVLLELLSFLQDLIKMPYATKAIIQHKFDTDHLNVWVTFDKPMRRTSDPLADPVVYDVMPPLALWLLEADSTAVALISSEWLDEHTLLLTSDTVVVEPTGVTLAYNGPNVLLCTTWRKDWEPWGPIASFAGYPTTPALHYATHEDGGADELSINGLSGVSAAPQLSYASAGDKSAWDFNTAYFIKDGALHDIDFSSKVPANTKAVLLTFFVRSPAANNWIFFQKKGYTGGYNGAQLRTQVANVYYGGLLIIELNTNGVSQYQIENTLWNDILLVIAGTFL
jgi:hypothetical protein